MIRAALNCTIAAAALWQADLFAATAPGQVRELSRLSLEDLANVEVTSVSKAAQALSAAPAAIYVITREEIVRSGVTSIPEALRLAPNLQLAQISAGSYAISARGFGDKREVQTQANKLLILIDGRSVYSPLFSGVFYDAQDIMMEDVERIEVISGPGATLWGANAMNGVINIITRPAADTQGTWCAPEPATRRMRPARAMAARSAPTARTASMGKRSSAILSSCEDGSSPHDRWKKTQGGVRADWTHGRDSWTSAR